MFTIKCCKRSGLMHVYEAEDWTLHPPGLDANDEMVTTVEHTSARGNIIQHHVAYPHDVFYAEIFIENANGRTIEVIRPKPPKD